MPTTIQLREETLQRLKEAKAERGARSYDELIRHLLKQEARRGTRFGSRRDMAPFEHGRTSHGD